MAKGIAFDFYQPQAPASQSAKPVFTGDRRTAPGPEIHTCDECGAPALFGEGVSLLKGIPGSWLCSRHCAPEFRRKKP
jgi:hypothetical protein